MYVSFIEHSLAANVVLGIRWCSALSTLQLDRSDNDSTYYAYDWGETDTSKEVEYTDWQQVSRFAQDFLALQYKSSYHAGYHSKLLKKHG